MVARKKPASQALALPAFEVTMELKQYLQEFESNLSDDEKILWAQAKQLRVMNVTGYMLEGQVFKKLRDNTEHGHFKTALAENGFKTRYAYDRIQVAEKFTQVAISNFEQGDGLGISKLRKVAAWDDAQVVDFFDGNEVYGFTIEDAQDMSSLEFEAQIKANKDETKALQHEVMEKSEALDDAEEEIEQLKRRLNGQDYLGEWPDIVSVIRVESSALTTSSLSHIDEMERLYREFNDEADLSEAETNAAVTALYHNLTAMQAKAGVLLKSIITGYGKECDLAADDNITQLNFSEMTNVLVKRRLLTKEADQERQLRDQQREAKKGPRRGRPRKTGGQS